MKYRYLKNLLTIILLAFANFLVSSFDNPGNTDKLTKKITGIYQNAPFIGVKLYRYKRNDYLICSVELPVSASSDLYTLAKVKAQSFINEFLNGSNVNSSSSVILEEEKQTSSKSQDENTSSSGSTNYVSKIITKINTNASGFVNGISTLTTLQKEGSSNKVFIFCKQVE